MDASSLTLALFFFASVLSLTKSANVIIPWYEGIPNDDATAVVPVGTTVSWVWSDSKFHSVIGMGNSSRLFQGPGGSFDVRGPPFTYNFTFEAEGNYSYFCAPHASTMRGVIAVVPASEPFTIQWRLGISVKEASVTVPVGSVVKWVWSDQYFHSIQDSNFTRDLFIGVGGGKNFISAPFTYEYVFSRIGDFSYNCGVFPSMLGVISVVSNVNQASPPTPEIVDGLVLISRPPPSPYEPPSPSYEPPSSLYEPPLSSLKPPTPPYEPLTLLSNPPPPESPLPSYEPLSPQYDLSPPIPTPTPFEFTPPASTPEFDPLPPAYTSPSLSPTYDLPPSSPGYDLPPPSPSYDLPSSSPGYDLPSPSTSSSPSYDLPSSSPGYDLPSPSPSNNSPESGNFSSNSPCQPNENSRPILPIFQNLTFDSSFQLLDSTNWSRSVSPMFENSTFDP